MCLTTGFLQFKSQKVEFVFCLVRKLSKRIKIKISGKIFTIKKVVFLSFVAVENQKSCRNEQN